MINNEGSCFLSENYFSRDTVVVELILPRQIGSGLDGERKVKAYLLELSRVLNLAPMLAPEIHLSPKYGLSGWLPLERSAAIHLYAWDGKEGEMPPFVSVDVSTLGAISMEAEIAAHIQEFFEAAVDVVVYKTIQDRKGINATTWRQLAPHICRQRLAISGQRESPFDEAEIGSYMVDLCRILRMSQLSDPFLYQRTAWMHWESSGMVANWDEVNFAADIYTCKPFRPEDAVEFTYKRLGLKSVIYMEF